MKYEIVHADGTVSDMTLATVETTAEAEVAKWPEEARATVVEIRAVEEFRVRPPMARANQSATGPVQSSQDVECTVAELAGLEVNRAIATDARAPNDETGKGTGMLVFRVNGVWKTSVGTPVST